MGSVMLRIPLPGRILQMGEANCGEGDKHWEPAIQEEALEREKDILVFPGIGSVSVVSRERSVPKEPRNLKWGFAFQKSTAEWNFVLLQPSIGSFESELTAESWETGESPYHSSMNWSAKLTKGSTTVSISGSYTRKSNKLIPEK